MSTLPAFFSRSRRQILATVLGLGALSALVAGEPPPREYQLKAVFLFNFAQFIHWPPAAFDSPTAPFVIGILGSDPFEGALDEAVAGEMVNGRPIQVRRFSRIEEGAAAHILFVDDSMRPTVDRVLGTIRARPILTVSDIPGFARRGGTVGFYFDGTKLRFEINQAEAQRNGLQLSSQLLKLARIVPSSGTGD
jgi:hypothetical protein